MKAQVQDAANENRRRTIITVVTTFALITVIGLIIAPHSWPIVFVIWLIIIIGGCLFFIVKGHAATTIYRCEKCGHEFSLSAIKDFISPHTTEKKYLTCQSCGERSWASELMRTGKKAT